MVDIFEIWASDLDYFHFPRLRAVYLSIPKNACSTIKRSSLVYEGDLSPSDNPKGHIHKLTQKYRVPHEAARDLCSGQHSLPSFTILSSPLRRYISSYLDKFCLAYPSPEPYVAAFPLGPNISFLQFLEYVSEAPAEALNEHWRHQSSFTSPDIQIEHYFWLDDLHRSPLLAIGPHQLPIMNIDHHSTSRIEHSLDPLNLSIFSTAKEIHENLILTNKLPPKRLFVSQLCENKCSVPASIYEHQRREIHYVRQAFNHTVSIPNELEA